MSINNLSLDILYNINSFVGNFSTTASVSNLFNATTLGSSFLADYRKTPVLKKYLKKAESQNPYDSKSFVQKVYSSIIKRALEIPGGNKIILESQRNCSCILSARRLEEIASFIELSDAKDAICIFTEITKQSKAAENFLQSKEIAALPEILKAKAIKRWAQENAELHLLSIRQLFLAFRGLRTIPKWIAHLKGLTDLDLSMNQLREIPKECALLNQLKKLNLYQNQLNSLPLELFNLPFLEILNLSVNEFESLPPEIGNLSSLKELILTDNKIRTLPSELRHLTNLRTLFLRYNPLYELPPAVCELSSLKILVLDHTLLKTLPNEINNLSQLIDLNLRENVLESLPKIDNLTYLQYLDLGNNKLSVLPKRMECLNELQFLYLNGNNLSELNLDLSKLSQLAKLDLSNNFLEKEPAVIQNIQNLRELYLEDNPFVPKISFKLKNLQIITLDEKQTSAVLRKTHNVPYNLRCKYTRDNIQVFERPRLPLSTFWNFSRSSELSLFY